MPRILPAAWPTSRERSRDRPQKTARIAMNFRMFQAQRSPPLLRKQPGLKHLQRVPGIGDVDIQATHRIGVEPILAGIAPLLLPLIEHRPEPIGEQRPLRLKPGEVRRGRGRLIGLRLEV